MKRLTMLALAGLLACSDSSSSSSNPTSAQTALSGTWTIADIERDPRSTLPDPPELFEFAVARVDGTITRIPPADMHSAEALLASAYRGEGEITYFVAVGEETHAETAWTFETTTYAAGHIGRERWSVALDLIDSSSAAGEATALVEIETTSGTPVFFGFWRGWLTLVR